MDKQKIWNEKISQAGTVVDGLGLELDEDIKECVVGFWVNGFSTAGSCGGHIGEKYRPLLFPYVYIEPLNRPDNRYVGEKELKEEMVKKYSLKDYRDIYDNKEIWKEYEDRAGKLEESPEWIKWYDACLKKRGSVESLLDEYKNYNNGSKIITEETFPGYRIEYDFDEEKLKDVDLSKNYKMFESDLLKAKDEFKKLTEFLKKRYFWGM